MECSGMTNLTFSYGQVRTVRTEVVQANHSAQNLVFHGEEQVIMKIGPSNPNGVL